MDERVVPVDPEHQFLGGNIFDLVLFLLTLISTLDLKNYNFKFWDQLYENDVFSKI